MNWAEIGAMLGALLVGLAPLYHAVFLQKRVGNGVQGLRALLQSSREEMAALRESARFLDVVREDLGKLDLAIQRLRVDLARSESWERDIIRLERQVERLRENLHALDARFRLLEGKVEKQ